MNLNTLKHFAGFLARAAGKNAGKVIAVLGLSEQAADQAVRHVHRGANGIPIWLFCTSQPNPDTAAMCERVFVRRSSVLSLIEAQRLLWPYRVALSIGTWTGQKGGWSFKIAPFLIPPFRTLFVNRSGDFVNGNSAAVVVHMGRCIRESISGGWCALREAAHDTRDFAGMACRSVQGKLLSASHTVNDVVGAMLVRCAAAALETVGSPQRTWFGRVHGTLPLEVALSGPPGKGVTAIRASGRDWHWAAIEAEVTQSEARWLIWNESGSACAVDFFLPLFEDERTFAVSVQRHFRSWSPSMVFTAPFRQLQAGEAARVLAPISETIVVDRRKLAALGIPRCGLSATAWLDIFWRAAAAGWRSYSVGAALSDVGRDPRPAVQQPDYPMLEAEFFFRALMRPGLRRIGPREAELTRGNLAFSVPSPLAATHEPGRLRVLVVSPFLPFPLSHGGAVRIYNLCRALRDRVDFFLIAVRERDEYVDYDKLGEVFREVHVVDLDELPSGDDDVPEQVRHHQSRSLGALMRDLAVRVRPDLVQIEYTHMAHFADAFAQEAQLQIPCILVEHDITFSLYRQLMETHPATDARREYERWHAYESRYLRAFDAVWTMSDDDRHLAVREGSHRESTFTVPNGVDTVRFVPDDVVEETPEILYVGSFRHLPNLIGFEMLCREVMPQVWQRHPNARLHVVAGPQHEMFRERFRGKVRAGVDERIQIEGFVADLRPLYARAAVVAVPLAVSAGTNIKVLEAMACGKAIVSTAVGCAGLGLHDGEELLIRDAAHFGAAICDLLELGELRGDLGAAARRTAEQRFSWNAIADQAYSSYLDVWAPVAWTEVESKAS